MPTTTPNLSLTLWDPVADTNQTFLNFRTALAGPTNSNMTKIDTAIELKAPINSPTFTGTPIAPTAATGTSTTQIATTAFVNSEIANDAAPIAHVGSTGSSHGVATTSVHGFMSSTDKTKLDGVATGANNYTHPANHAPSVITQDVNNRFVTDAEKSTWNGKASPSVMGTTTIPTTGWVANTGDNALKCNITIAGVEIGNWVDVTVDKDYQDAATAIALNGTVEEYNGGITVFANVVPTEAIPIRYKVDK